MLARGGVVEEKPKNHRRPWSDRDKLLLIDLWSGTALIENIAEKLGRSVIAVREYAMDLGLHLGCPQGFEYLTAATLRCGFSTTEDLRRVLSWARVRIYVGRALKSTRGSQWRRHFVDPEHVDAAMAKWNETEPVQAAARRIGVSGPTLRSWLRLAGVENNGTPGVHWRVTEAEVERARAMCQRPELVGKKLQRRAQEAV